MDFALEIKSRLTAKQVFSHYGFEVNRAGFMCCCFHTEKTASMKIYEKSFHCFGCGAHGDVIEFVQRHFSLNFYQAMEKLNADFSLGLPIGQQMTLRQRHQLREAVRLREQQREQEQRERQTVEDEYNAAFDEWVRLDKQRRELAPVSPLDPPDERFLEAIKNIGYAEYRLEVAKERRWELDRRRRDSKP